MVKSWGFAVRFLEVKSRVTMTNYVPSSKLCNLSFSFPIFIISMSSANSLQSCPTLCDSMDCSPPCSSVHGILQTRILEWVAMPSSRGSDRPRDQTCVSLHLLHWQADSLPLAQYYVFHRCVVRAKIQICRTFQTIPGIWQTDQELWAIIWSQLMILVICIPFWTI